MKLTQIALFLGLCVASAYASAKEVKWKEVYSGSDYHISIDPKSIVHEADDIVAVDTRMRIFDEHTARMQIDHVLVRVRFDCKVDGRFQFISTLVVSTGEEGTYGQPTDQRWHQFAPTSPEGIMGLATCKRANKLSK